MMYRWLPRIWSRCRNHRRGERKRRRLQHACNEPDQGKGQNMNEAKNEALHFNRTLSFKMSQLFYN